MNPEKTKYNYYSNKNRLLQILYFFSPSAVGITTYLVIYFIFFLLDQNSSINKVIHNISLNDIKTTFVGGYINDVSKFLSSDLANSLTIYTFWIIIATLIFFIGSSIFSNIHELNRDMRLRYYLFPQGTDKDKPFKMFLKKFLFRLGILILLIIYVYKIIPLLIDIFKTSNLVFKLDNNFFISLISTLFLEIIILHFGIILLRLFLLKRRIIE